jgi:N-ethylmaleimide reductase
LTRNRASEPNLCPHDLHVQYYSSRATPGGLLITEATNISPEAMGYPSVPGIWTSEQADSWKRVTNAVHVKGGKIFCQLWHVGRVAQKSYGDHPLIKNSGLPLPSVSASNIPMTHPTKGFRLPAMTYKGKEECDVPRALRTDEIPRLIENYRHAARQALIAGFDGVELHAAHGYLIDQFINDGTNKRTDQYGGSIENRCRLLNEILKELCMIMGDGRVAVRLSPTTILPNGKQNQMYYVASCSDPDEVYPYAVNCMNQYPLAYLLLTEPRWSGRDDGNPSTDTGFSKPLSNQKYRKIYKGTLMAAGGFTPVTAAKAIEEGTYDLVAFGRWFISNPDLVEKIRNGNDLTVYERDTFYQSTFEGGGELGYTDYPVLGEKMGRFTTMKQDVLGASRAASKL